MKEQSIPDWISAVCSTFTLLFAYFIYRKYDLDKKFAEKQFDIVLEFVKHLDGKRYRFVKYINKLPGTNLFAVKSVKVVHLVGVIKMQQWTITQDERDSILVIPLNHYIGEETVDYGYKMFMPKVIAKEIKMLNTFEMLSSSESFDVNKIEDYIFLEDVTKDSFLKSPEEYLVCKSQPYNNVMEFINRHQIIREKINTWLKEHGGNDLNI